VAPGSVTSGSKVYVVTSKNQSGAMGGHIEAYNTDTSPSAAPGTAVGSALWDAGSPAKMGAATRRDRLWSTLATPGGGAPGAGALAKLAGMDAAAFGWPLSPAQTCVPSLATILAYTFNPSYGTAGDTGSGGMGFPAPVAGCSYLAGREPNWMLGSMSPNDGVQYLGAPGSASLLDLPGYPAFASRNKGRQGLVLAASNDGILYGIDADTGAMHWGWMPRPFVAQLAQYTALASRQLFDGGFRVADAVDASNGWASYVVGTAQGGAYHYALQLTGNASATETTPPGPAAQAWGIGVPGGTSPQMQEPVVVTVGGRQYALFVVNTTSGATTTSALYEVNVATGQAAGGGALSASLPFAAHSAMSYDAQTGTLWLGDKTGGVWSVSITGQSTADAATALQRGAVSPAAPINFVGYGESEGIPYVWAAAKDKLTMFTLSGSGMAPAAWASQGGTSPQGYKAGNASAAVRALKQGGQISAPPVLANGVLVVPVHVPPAAGSCGAGQGYYQLFDLASGSDPKIRITYNGADVVAGEIYLGAGAPLTPGLHGSEKGIVGYPGTDAPPAAGSNPSLGSINFGGKPLSRAILWRQR
jgi:type IV pilus assembly protein PilY1